MRPAARSSPPPTGSKDDSAFMLFHCVRSLWLFVSLALMVCCDLRANPPTLEWVIDNVTIPEVTFKDKPAWECFEFIAAYRPQNVGRLSIVLLRSPTKTHQKVSVTMRDVSLRAVIAEVCRLAGLTYKPSEFAVIVGEQIPASPLLTPGNVADGIATRWSRVILSNAEFRDATLSQALDFIAKQSRAVDPEHRGVRFSPQAELPPDSSITLFCHDIPCSVLLRYLCLISGMRFEFAGDEVKVFPR